MRLLIENQLALILAVCPFLFLQAVAQNASSDALQLEVARDGAAQSGRPLILDLGTNVGGKEYAGEIKFSITDERGRMRHLVKRDPMFVAGTLGPYIVTIPEGGTFELPAIDLVDYWSYEPKIAALALPAGRYLLTAEYTGHNPNEEFIPAPAQPPAHQYTQNFWIGTVDSNVMVFTLTSPIGDQPAH
ncbi:hypothetical protein [Tunturiibacter gelidiferens]|uniref:DUF2141 domain-containing protein n=2 Tax=Tunturiibacter gelidiferens TaxID=3069689 RepID=A0AAU7Z2F1_9BACT